jgi:hypothetical protein
VGEREIRTKEEETKKTINENMEKNKTGTQSENHTVKLKTRMKRLASKTR